MRVLALIHELSAFPDAEVYVRGIEADLEVVTGVSCEQDDGYEIVLESDDPGSQPS